MNAENKNQVQAEEDKTSKTDEDVIVRDKSRKKAIILAAIGVALALLAVIIIALNAFGDSDKKLQEQLDLGAKYLEEMDYERALVAFNAALAIEPKNADAYLGIVEVYIRTNDFEAALKYAQEGYEATGDERLKEKIDMIESGSILATNGWVMKRMVYDGEGNLVYWHEYTYNLKGQMASMAKFNAQGVQEQYGELTYDEEGRRLIEYTSDPDGDLSKHRIEYNENGYRDTWYMGTSDEIRGYRDVETDSDGRMLKGISYFADGSVNATTIYEYNEEGKLIRKDSYDSNNQLIEYTIYTYNEEGRDWLHQRYDGNNVLIDYSENLYDEEGKSIGNRRYDANGVLKSETVYQ